MTIIIYLLISFHSTDWLAHLPPRRYLGFDLEFWREKELLSPLGAGHGVQTFGVFSLWLLSLWLWTILIRLWMTPAGCLWTAALGMPNANAWLHNSLHLWVLFGHSVSSGPQELLICLRLQPVFSVSPDRSLNLISCPWFMMLCINVAIKGREISVH